MTIVTKPLSEKKGEKLQEPLVDDVNVGVLLGNRDNIEAGHGVPDKRTTSMTTACLFITALLVLSCGIITGVCIYRQYARSQMHKFYGWCSVPYEESRVSASSLQGGPYSDELTILEKVPKWQLTDDKPNQKYFKEEFEIDESYEKITVPDFSGGRKSRFIHDFKLNQTGIVDIDGKRCFVMPLNRTQVLPPKNLLDVVMKMWDGYYDVDTEVLRDTMRVVTPAVENRSSLGIYIQRECFGYPIYKLEKYVSGVYKRSASPEVRFIEFAGKNTVELNILNYDELSEHESQLPVAME